MFAKESGSAPTLGRINLIHNGMSSVVRANADELDLVTVGLLSNGRP